MAIQSDRPIDIGLVVTLREETVGQHPCDRVIHPEVLGLLFKEVHRGHAAGGVQGDSPLLDRVDVSDFDNEPRYCDVDFSAQKFSVV